MDEELKKYESTIKRKHSFGLNPKYEEEFRFDLNKNAFEAIVVKIFQKLDWEIVSQSDLLVEAKRKNKKGNCTEKIIVSYEEGKIKVKSISNSKNFWDIGNNSLRVRLFLYAFQQIVLSLTQEEINVLIKENNSKKNWDDYIIPEKLPQPIKKQVYQVWKYIVLGIILSIVIGLLFAILSTTIKIKLLYEMGVGFAISYYMTDLLKSYHYTKNQGLIILIFVTIIYLSKQFLHYYMANGFIFSNMIGDLLQVNSWTMFIIFIQWLISFIVAQFLFYFIYIQYLIERVPKEVLDFAFYLSIVKNKEDQEVRMELSKMGWIEKEDQDEVFSALESLPFAIQINRHI